MTNFLLILLVSFFFSNSWELNINAVNIDQNIPGDWITMGVCDECSDGFQYGTEDFYDMPCGLQNCTDIYFFNPHWLGIPDSNGYYPQHPYFASDIRSIHPPEDLLVWNISGLCSDEIEAESLFLVWNLDSLNQDYNIQMFVDNVAGGYDITDMRASTSKQIQCDDLSIGYEEVDGEVIYFSKIRILMGAIDIDSCDLDFNGEINILDIIMVLNCILELEGCDYICMDYNEDAEINIFDVILMVDIILND